MTDWIGQFPALDDLPAALRARLVNESRLAALPEGTRIFGPGQAPSSFLILLSGSVRVQQVSENGREIVLYRISAGESCALTTACILGYEDYRAEAIAETAVEAIATPRATFEDLIAQSPPFRRFVFKTFSDRITDLFRIIDEIAFSRVDIRLAQKLAQLRNANGDVEATHHQLATELGTAREVVSRQLQEFQRRGWVKIGRGLVSVPADSALFDFARSNDHGSVT
ncbi:transcriptional regulator, Crp/Fnr family [Rhodomicrobium vannielii ATCC 17100]|uniref:Transcriptional regulator, Crp/Fnr family n=1 Tax=Rhodomicrobium vannielii (strain ATCC 17100 / DSM 162 / LMG 4299 / NCIMB 10020 / ATH 3.1.1) TaxID=648757 RepID=E3I0M1_RHOVT|nr:Crp/Fnr family transcriptional regulator [Rhodomicrobium vannielii]ADP70031.1 transcriptional regulator, Crp/Fnr family [Rhodomicrobium vannielii ATCC 17100]